MGITEKIILVQYNFSLDGNDLEQQLSTSVHKNFFKCFIYLFFRERGKEGESEGDKHPCVREALINCFSLAPHWGPGPQPRHVPWLESNWWPFGSQPMLNPLSHTSQGCIRIFYTWHISLFSQGHQPLFPFRGVQPFGISGPHWKEKCCLRPHIKYTNTNKNWWAYTHNGLCTIFLISATTDKQKSLHMITLIMQQPFW